MDESIERFIREVAEEKGISRTALEKAFRMQFKVLKDTVVSVDRNDPTSYRTVYIKNFGKFVPNRKKLTWFRTNVKDGKRIRDSEGLRELADKESRNREGVTEKN